MTIQRNQKNPTVINQRGQKLRVGVSELMYGLVMLAGIITPLLFLPGLNNAIELPRAMLIRFLAGLILFLLAYSPLKSALLNRRLRPIIIGTMALASTLLIATILSKDVNLSLWGRYQSQYGLLTWLSLLTLFLAALVSLNTCQRQRQFTLFLIGSSCLAMVYVLASEQIGDPFPWERGVLLDESVRTSLSDYLGTFVLLIIPLTAAELFSADRRWPFTIALIGQIVVLIQIQSYSTWLGFLSAVIVFGLLVLYFNGKKRLASWIAGTVLVLMIMLALSLTISGIPRFFTVADNFEARLSIWRAFSILLAERPFFGYGPDTFHLVIQRMYPLDLAPILGYQPEVSSARNLWLDVGISAGLLGLATHTFLLASSGRLIWRRLRSTIDQKTRFMLIGMVTATIGHLVTHQFSSETIGPAVVFWLLLAAGIGGFTQPDPDSGSSSVKPWKVLPLALAVVILIGMVTLPPLFADRAYRQGQQFDLASKKALAWYVEATQQWSIEPLYHMALAEAYWASGQPAAASSEVVSTANLQPANGGLWAAVGNLYARWGTDDPARLTLAIAAFSRAIDLSPNSSSYHAALGRVLAKSGRLGDGIREVEQAVSINPYDRQAFADLAELYEEAGLPEKARRAAEQAHMNSELPPLDGG